MLLDTYRKDPVMARSAATVTALNGGQRARGNKARLADEAAAKAKVAVKPRVSHAGRTTAKVKETAAEKRARLQAQVAAGKPVTMSLELPVLKSKFLVHNDYTARVAHRCRTEIGMTPERIMGEMFRGEASADTVVAVMCLARWQQGDNEVSYFDELDAYTNTQFIGMVLDLADEDDSPEGLGRRS